ncbi:restriction endonuclease subunit S [Albidovulum sediminicola]|uniref:Restriction endonuclease subunit S n=1 Tax=Albidovulum sediminicola TaxID=2984331 RepID=A0ABT2Z1U9_9RHOB|nr:restriction endonuclease subunit S [Defluviimonas sp. WL0075]MCV2865015.1 restriction endonuclease subunit S [Defluviimonas sp. WL0075]
MSDFVPLADLCLKITKGTTPNAKDGGFADSGINYIKSESLSYDGSIDATKFAFISEETNQRLKRSIIQDGDILYSIAGANLGKCGIARSEYLPANTNQAVAIIRVDERRASSRFVSLCLRNPSFVQSVLGGVAQSAQPNVNLADIGRFRIPNLPLPEQRAIAATLGALDDKIELNRKMNATLEAMARALFRDWFVDFGPTRAKAEGRPPYLSPDLWPLFPARLDAEGKPEGWAAGTLGAVATARNEGVDPSAISPDTPYIGLEHMPRGSIALADWEGAGKVSSNKAAFAAGDFLFGKLRPYFHKVGIAPVAGICSTDIVVARPKSAAWAGFVLACISDEEFVAYTDKTSTGTKMPRTSWSIMAKYPVTLPPAALAQAFNDTVSAMFERIKANIHESRTLAQTRDLLLPRLMSGELLVAKISASNPKGIA